MIAQLSRRRHRRKSAFYRFKAIGSCIRLGLGVDHYAVIIEEVAEAQRPKQLRLGSSCRSSQMPRDPTRSCVRSCRSALWSLVERPDISASMSNGSLKRRRASLAIGALTALAMSWNRRRKWLPQYAGTSGPLGVSLPVLPEAGHKAVPYIAVDPHTGEV